MNFWQKIKSSVYDPEFYRAIPKETFGSALRYYLLLCLLITILRMAFLVFPISFGISSFLQYINNYVVHTYPANLQVAIHNGYASANVKQPYKYPVCDQNNNCAFLIIDTKNSGTGNYLRQPHVLMVLTHDAVYFKGNDDGIREYSLANIKNVTVNKKIATEFVHQLSPWVKFVIPITILFAGIGVYITYLFNLIYLLFVALLLWLLAKKFAPGMTYGQSYKVALHAVTLAILLALFLGVTSWLLHIAAFPFMGTLIIIIIFILNFTTAGIKTVQKPFGATRKKKK